METPATDLELASNWLEITGEDLPKEAGQLPADKVQTLANIFEPFMRQVVELRKDAMAINVTDESDTARMEQARSLRLTIKRIRTEAEKQRKDEKQFSLITGKMVQWFGNQIKELATITETHLQEQETYAARMEQQRIDAIGEKREEEIYQFAVMGAEFPGLATMTEEVYQTLLQQTKEAFEYRQAKAKEEEAARIAQEAAEKAERERLEAESAKLKAIQEQQAQEAAEAARKEAEAREAFELKDHEYDPIRQEKFLFWEFFKDKYGLTLTDGEIDIIIERAKQYFLAVKALKQSN